MTHPAGDHRVHQAFERFRQHSTRNSPAEEILLPLVEALCWAVSADEELSKDDNGGKNQKYLDDRQKDPDRQLLPAIRYARNRYGHQRALVIEKHNARTYPRRYPSAYVTIKWRPAAQLPHGDQPQHNLGQQDYETHLEGRRAEDTLERVAAWFAKQP